MNPIQSFEDDHSSLMYIHPRILHARRQGRKGTTAIRKGDVLCLLYTGKDTECQDDPEARVVDSRARIANGRGEVLLIELEMASRFTLYDPMNDVPE